MMAFARARRLKQGLGVRSLVFAAVLGACLLAGAAGACAMQIRSAAFENGEKIPVRYTGDGANVSPPLAWSGIPRETRSLALICDDPDAPRGTWVHWVVFNLPPDLPGLPEQTVRAGLPAGAGAGANSAGSLEYAGPKPPSGTHRYFFKLYALDTKFDDLAPGLPVARLMEAMQGHIIEKAELMGLYSRR